MSIHEYPSAMSHAKARDWLASHPQIDAEAFWLDQAAKNLKKSASALRWMAVWLVVAAVGSIGIAVVNFIRWFVL